MKATFSLLLLLICCGCTAPIVKTLPSIKITPLTIELPENSSFRGLSKLNNTIAIGGSPNLIGIYENGQVKLQSIKDTLVSDFRAIGQTNENLFALRAGSPAKLYQINKQTLKHQLVYVETDKNVFYDALHFFNPKDGIAFGDELNGCMSVITTNNGGGSWQKLDCEKFLPAPKGAGAFAASNTNISIIGNHVWLAAGKVVYYSPNKGKTWQKQTIPIIQEGETEGLYSIHFFDELNGIGVGGDFANPEATEKTIIKTTNGGKTWTAISNELNYRSCVQYVPNSAAKQVMVVGFNGISFSTNGGVNWQQISDSNLYYSFRFLNENEGLLVGKNSIARFQLR